MGLPFEQQPKESAKAFAAFSLYLSLGSERSIRVVGERLRKSAGLMERWSRRFDWPARAKAHAAHLAMVEREASEALVRGVSAEWLRRQQALRETEWEMHEQCIAAAKRGLKAFMEREKAYANLADIARVLEVASKLGRLASGMATDKTELTGEDGGPIRVELSAALEKVYGAVVDVEGTVSADSPQGGEADGPALLAAAQGEGGDTSPRPSPQSGEGGAVKGQSEGAGDESTSPRRASQGGKGEEGGNTSPQPSPQSGEGEEGAGTSARLSTKGGKGECEGIAL